MLMFLLVVILFSAILVYRYFRIRLILALLALSPSAVFADWTPMLSSSSFSGIQTDVQTAASGILAIALVILGVGLLIRVLSR